MKIIAAFMRILQVNIGRLTILVKNQTMSMTTLTISKGNADSLYGNSQRNTDHFYGNSQRNANNFYGNS
jgi:hypothetical protein